MGVKLDEEINSKVRGEEAVITTPDSKVTVAVIPTDEEFMIASDTMEILKNLKIIRSKETMLLFNFPHSI